MLWRAKGWFNNESTQTAQLHAHGCFSLLQTSPDVAFAILFAIRCSPIRRCLYLPVSLFFTPLQSATAPGYPATLSNFRLTKSTILPTRLDFTFLYPRPSNFRKSPGEILATHSRHPR
ncbi:hypothetical protein PGTUg99_021758 [Puccinia graminis f. sp. tritici]|uniref:Uncharacterized protein n=1 Tax=Puccinia graminis f. sp. tritici TaxID=56615 RepID=A0A5B0RZ51_PUCGR|nr:hypothetical protein PGTUg99_021758 [Puccinia graminis f. sp. tritici]